MSERPGMRTRWRFRWGPQCDFHWGDVLALLAVVWFALGLCTYIVTRIITTPHGRGSCTWTLLLWTGPFAIAVLAAALWCLWRGAAWLVKHPPVGRVTEAVPDIREVYRDPSCSSVSPGRREKT